LSNFNIPNYSWNLIDLRDYFFFGVDAMVTESVPFAMEQSNIVKLSNFSETE
jgi:hypothetical protein